jgi:ribonuclease HI
MENYNTTIQSLPALPNAVNVWTDGSANWKDRSGGFAYIVQGSDNVVKYSYAQGVSDTTVSRMELTAALRALESLKDRSIVQLITDSEYLGKGIVEWMEGWRKAGWKIKNGDLWNQIYNVVRQHDVFVTRIDGHSGEPLNDEVDKLASQARKSLLIEVI